MTEEEMQIMKRVQRKTNKPLGWVPMAWSINLINEMRKNKFIGNLRTFALLKWWDAILILATNFRWQGPRETSDGDKEDWISQLQTEMSCLGKLPDDLHTGILMLLIEYWTRAFPKKGLDQAWPQNSIVFHINNNIWSCVKFARLFCWSSIP